MFSTTRAFATTSRRQHEGEQGQQVQAEFHRQRLNMATPITKRDGDHGVTPSAPSPETEDHQDTITPACAQGQ